ncbi:MAG: ABC transporter permease [Ahniella sp.]|nr:ABC transporter permease [Ahniella sp.]
MVSAALDRLGRRTVSTVAGFGYGAMVLVESLFFLVFGRARGQRVRWSAIAEQMRVVGIDAIPIVCLLSLTVGVMLAIQFIAALREFGAETGVIIAIAKSITREFGVLITGILIAGRSGSAFAARIGSMNVSQEVDALAVMGVDPVRYLAAPALAAMLVMMPCLTLLADVVAIVGSGLYAGPMLDMSLYNYLQQTLELIKPRDLLEGLGKSVVFAVLITLVGVCTGFSVQGGAEGVGRATTRAVVWSITAIILADMAFSFS